MAIYRQIQYQFNEMAEMLHYKFSYFKTLQKVKPIAYYTATPNACLFKYYSSAYTNIPHKFN